MLSTFALMFSYIYHVVEKTVANLSKPFIDLLGLEQWSSFCGDGLFFEAMRYRCFLMQILDFTIVEDFFQCFVFSSHIYVDFHHFPFSLHRPPGIFFGLYRSQIQRKRCFIRVNLPHSERPLNTRQGLACTTT